MTELLLGAATGLLFGFFLQKARVLRFEKQVGFLRLRDMTIIKFMFSAVVVGMAGVYLLKHFGVLSLGPKAVHLGGQIAGGLLFGIGWAVAGYCPGTSVGAVGEGRVHALAVVLGMVAGAAAYAEVHGFFKKTVLTWGSLGKVTLPELLHVSPWIIIAGFAVFAAVIFAIFEKVDL